MISYATLPCRVDGLSVYCKLLQPELDYLRLSKLQNNVTMLVNVTKMDLLLEVMWFVRELVG